MYVSMPRCQRLARAWWPFGPAWWQATMLHVDGDGGVESCGRCVVWRLGQSASYDVAFNVVRSHPSMTLIRSRWRHQPFLLCSYRVLCSVIIGEFVLNSEEKLISDNCR